MHHSISRRELLKLGVAGAAGLSFVSGQTTGSKKVIVIGGGIAGLCTGYELMKRGHDVMVLEATGRAGGHIRTISEPLADGLYGDGGAEHITRPGYELFWNYTEELDLEVCRCLQRDDVWRLIDGRWYTQEMLRDPAVLDAFGFNRREIDFLAENPWHELGMLYYHPYLDNFEDEYHPFAAGLDELDQISIGQLLRQDGASEAAMEQLGGSASALHVLWHAAILRLRGNNALYPAEVFRLTGGNQKITDAFVRKLGRRLWLGCPVTGIEHGETGVRVSYSEFGRRPAVAEGDFAVCCINLAMLLKLEVKPGWTEEKKYAISHVPYYSNTRVLIQSRSRFWEEDGLSPNLSIDLPGLSSVWQMAAEVETERGLLEGAATGAPSAEAVLATFRDIYPGRSENIEQVQLVKWPLEPFAALCETNLYRPGELPRIWPEIIQPFGRIHFAGAYADNLNWGMEAATRSANRVAAAIDGQA